MVIMCDENRLDITQIRTGNVERKHLIVPQALPLEIPEAYYQCRQKEKTGQQVIARRQVVQVMYGFFHHPMSFRILLTELTNISKKEKAVRYTIDARNEFDQLIASSNWASIEIQRYEPIGRYSISKSGNDDRRYFDL